MRVLDPNVHDRESVCRFLRANGIDPCRMPDQPFIYDGRKREIHIEHVVFVDGQVELTPDGESVLTIPARHRVIRGREPSRYVLPRG